ncbi:MAG TPA: hypothetical protein VMI35_13820, partial [Puia sp.]|nr:hypothetical protein [Puia sp.]
MPEQYNQHDNQLQGEQGQVTWKLGPRDFVFKYLKYLPWLLISVILALVIAYIKIRYTTKIYIAQSSILIKTSRGGTKPEAGDRFDLFMDQSATNLNNEIQLLKSRPVLQRVVKDLDFQKSYFNKGKIRASLVYPESPVILEMVQWLDSTISVGFDITLLNEEQFSLGKNGKKINFGEPFKVDGSTCILKRNRNVPLRFLSSNDFTVRYSPLAAAASYLYNALSVLQLDNQATILTLTYKSENTELAKNFLNTLMAVYDSMIVEDKKQVAENTLNFINGRLEEVKDQLIRLEGGIKDFRVQNNIFDID